MFATAGRHGSVRVNQELDEGPPVSIPDGFRYGGEKVLVVFRIFTRISILY
jgi:hypothetical protein